MGRPLLRVTLTSPWVDRRLPSRCSAASRLEVAAQRIGEEVALNATGGFPSPCRMLQPALNLSGSQRRETLQ